MVAKHPNLAALPQTVASLLIFNRTLGTLWPIDFQKNQ